MSYPPFGTARIKCGKAPRCDWTGKETDLAKRDVTPPSSSIKSWQSVCPKCGCDSYEFIVERRKPKTVRLRRG